MTLYCFWKLADENTIQCETMGNS